MPLYVHCPHSASISRWKQKTWWKQRLFSFINELKGSFRSRFWVRKYRQFGMSIHQVVTIVIADVIFCLQIAPFRGTNVPDFQALANHMCLWKRGAKASRSEFSAAQRCCLGQVTRDNIFRIKFYPCTPRVHSAKIPVRYWKNNASSSFAHNCSFFFCNKTKWPGYFSVQSSWRQISKRSVGFSQYHLPFCSEELLLQGGCFTLSCLSRDGCFAMKALRERHILNDNH